jgi:hypothetical protein
MASFTLTATAHSRQADQETNHQQNTGGAASIDTPNFFSRNDALTRIEQGACSTSTTAYSSSIHSSAPLCTLADSALPRESEDETAKRLAAAQARRHRRQAMQIKAQKSKSVVSTTRHISSTTTKSSLEPSALTFTAPLPGTATQRVRRLILMLNKVFAPRLNKKL